MFHKLIISILTVFMFSINCFSQTYEFKSRFDLSQSSIAYSGQVFRQMNIIELKNYIASLKRGGYTGGGVEVSQFAIWSYIDFQNSTLQNIKGAVDNNSFFSFRPTSLLNEDKLSWKQAQFGEISSNKQLLNKMAGNDNPLFHKKLLGWNPQDLLVSGEARVLLSDVDYDGQKDHLVEPEDLVFAWAQLIAENSVNGENFSIKNGSQIQTVDKAYVTQDGLDLNQLINKFLYGAVNFSQVARDYLSTDLGPEKGLNADNTKAAKSGSKAYTALEHHWDEAFGYFGAARNHLDYSTEKYKACMQQTQQSLGACAKKVIDTNQDGFISPLSEINFGLSVTATKMDFYANSDLKLNEQLFELFYQGRKMISENQMTDLISVRDKILKVWEQALAAVSIHYINKTLAEMSEFSTPDYLFTDHAKFWGELKGYALSFQFNPQSLLSKEQFVEIHNLIGDRPTLMSAPQLKVEAYKKNLIKARSILSRTYGFSKKDTETL